MPAIPANTDKFLFTTDYPMDQIVYLKEASYTIGTGIDITIPHGLPFTPLPMLQWSLNSDFSVAYEDNTGPFPGNYTFFRVLLAIEANSTNFIIRGGNGSDAPQTGYIRIFGFQPSDSNAEIPSTVSSGDKFILNTDYNYMKLAVAGKTGSIAANSSTTVTHNLGFIPHVLTWVEYTGTIYPSIAMPRYNCTVEPTATTLEVRNEDTIESHVVHYRIYYD